MEYEELKSYLKDVYEVEKQLFSLRAIANMYENEIDRLNEECNTVYNMEVILGDDSSLFRQRIAVAPPNALYEIDNLYMPIMFEQRYPCRRWKLYDDIKKLEKQNKKFSLFMNINKLYDKGGVLYDAIIEYYTSHYNKDLEAKRNIYLPFCEKTTKEYTEQVLESLSTSEKLLTQLYAQDIIHPKYRNFLAIAQIYEYFDTGRCSELIGPNGAYNLYESELRQNIIIDRLDQIITQLQMLNRTMAYVASAINESNSILRDISSSLGRIEANTALVAYNSQCIAHNTRIASQYVL
ncbi:MAG: hypothetical protein IJO85_03310 [Lachnospiraceae bacterium]|nr:hypothetical protein [Lachnospiraceae bacterium]